jgi:hypothetical protein
MAFERLLLEIDAEISRLQQAKVLLSGASTGKHAPSRPAKSKLIAQGGGNEKRIPSGVISTNGSNQEGRTQVKRALSAKARKAIADAQRKRWAKIRAAKKKAAAA